MDAPVMGKDDILPVVVQDVKTNSVLMLGYMNQEALELTKSTGFMHYWSRSKGGLWKKGEISGNFQKVVSLSFDCDRDAILARVEQKGVACHTGSYSCFSTESQETMDVVKVLEDVFQERAFNPKEGSYVSQLLRSPDTVLRKLGEEALETILAAKGRNKNEVLSEASDLFFHLLLVLFMNDLTFADILEELRRRRR